MDKAITKENEFAILGTESLDERLRETKCIGDLPEMKSPESEGPPPQFEWTM
jgi:hypothetical protein